MSGFQREGRYIVVKPDCMESSRTMRLKSFIEEMCFQTPDCVVVEADWPEYEPVWKMIEDRVMGKQPEPASIEVKNPILGYAESYRTMIRVAIADQTPTDVSMYSVAVDIECNMAPLWDAQRLRADTAEAELKALKHPMNSAQQLRKDLAAAEQRIAELAGLLQYVRTKPGFFSGEFVLKLDAALNPNPEAESHE